MTHSLHKGWTPSGPGTMKLSKKLSSGGEFGTKRNSPKALPPHLKPSYGTRQRNHQSGLPVTSPPLRRSSQTHTAGSPGPRSYAEAVTSPSVGPTRTPPPHIATRSTRSPSRDTLGPQESHNTNTTINKHITPHRITTVNATIEPIPLSLQQTPSPVQSGGVEREGLPSPPAHTTTTPADQSLEGNRDTYNHTMDGETGSTPKPQRRTRFSNVVLPCSNSITPLSPSSQEQCVADTEPVQGTMGGPPGDEECEMMRGVTSKDMSNPKEPRSDSSPLNVLNNPTVPLTPSDLPEPLTRWEPTVHHHTDRKIVEWNITIHKPIVILGASNLARIPRFTHPKVQVDSFPGATCNHVREVLRKHTTQLPQVETVVLSLGLNNCLKRQSITTAWKQLQQLLKTSEWLFPEAQIYVPVINFSNRLLREQQVLLEQLNHIIIQRCQYLPDINPLTFHTEPRDPVHWTKDTASRILNSWLDQLNF